QEVRKRGHDATLILFHEGSVQYVTELGIPNYNYFAYERMLIRQESNESVFQKFGVENPHLLVSHERAAFEIRDSGHLYDRLANYLLGLEKIFADIEAKSKKKVLLVQEVGGFVSLVAS